jgi:hypothetical protein
MRRQRWRPEPTRYRLRVLAESLAWIDPYRRARSAAPAAFVTAVGVFVNQPLRM